jgi:ATP-binding cassette subfamily B protein
LTAETERQFTDRVLLLRLFREARKFWGHIAALFFLYMIVTPLTLLIPVPMKLAVDSVLGDLPVPGFLAFFLPQGVLESKRALLIFAAGLVFAVLVLLQLRALATLALRTYAGERLMLDFRSRLFRHVQRLSLSFHDSKGVSDSLYRIQYDATTIEVVAVNGVIPLLSSAITLLAMVFITFRLDWQLSTVALAVTPLVVVATRFYRPRLRSLWRKAKELESSVLGVVEEVLGTIRLVKAFGQEDHEETRFRTHAIESLRAKVRAMVTEGLFGLMMGIIVGLGTAAVLFVGVRHVEEGTLSLGNLVLVMLYLGMLYQPLEQMVTMIGALQNAFASADRAFTLLENTPEVDDRPDAVPLERAKGSFLFKGVSFAYESGRPVLDDVHLEVPAGTLVGIAGETGAGKTTFIGLLPRFHDPTAGQILLDDRDLKDYRLEDLRRQFSIVLQDPVLFSTSVRENILYGKPEASEDELIQAAKNANAHEFISRLPQGYENPVGQRGMLLSGGQRQLVSLARAFLRDAPVLILDEPTSSIDAGTEDVVLEALQRLVAGRTAFMISHRLYTLETCDQVLVAERGRLIPQPVPHPKAL